MHEIDHPKVFSSRDAIPEELRAEFEYLQSHMMSKVRIFSTISRQKFLKNYFQNPGKTYAQFLDEIPKEYQEPLQFTHIEESSKFSHVGVPDVFIDSNGKLFHGAPGGPHCRELTLHPLCCFIKSKLCSGDSSIVIKERLQEGSYSKYEYIIYDI